MAASSLLLTIRTRRQQVSLLSMNIENRDWQTGKAKSLSLK
ncbi:hypothetical protein [Acidithiobacillus sp. HP-6]|nr:hypothetical protein [Acidithiobacillus sp. HP-6]